MVQVFEMVVLVVAITVFGRIIMQHMRNRERQAPDAEAENRRLKSEVDELKQRIATLERIAVDKRHRLADEIDALDRERGA
jgi:cell division protein FtsB